MKEFLSNHPEAENIYSNLAGENNKLFFKNHVIVDKKDWEEAIRILMIKPMLTVPTEGYNPPPVKKLASQLRPDTFKTNLKFPEGLYVYDSLNDKEGIKHDSNKPRYDLIPADALEEVAKVYAVGAKKYGDRNWEEGLSYGRLYRALLGHVYSWWRGERDDKESKCHHLSAVIFNSLGLLHYELNSEKYSKFDDRK